MPKKFFFENTFWESKFSRVANTAEISEESFLSEFSINPREMEWERFL